MPSRPKSPCRYPNCRELLEAPGYCNTHVSLMRKQSDEKRGSSAERGYDSRWRKAREGYLSSHPLCECDECTANGLIKPATVVDHIIPHRLKEAMDSGETAAIVRSKALFWDRNNWKAMAKSCHDKKTAREDGGFGRRG